ncbi:pilus assembly protein FimV [Shewanella sp. Scap07]|uniref:FimV/HubP family polar landmark protein n=1 Tax=Shewanella sp. Scap07 TaxID=2589987 RepID=UPI0015BF8B98|nr:FimV/HubP family polar landmark protein [Shewanella sp. Scap07]QLE85972.1 pilus assembly protein FimV [Shewanella sp. Scap07]
MNFRTTYLVGLMAAGLLVFATNSPVGSAIAAEPLKITGPDGQVRQSSSQYGPTRSSDTFWSIAQKTRPDSSVSIYQVMAAIYDANPHAFSSDNYNSLERGMILLIPSKEVMLQIPASLAKKRAERDDKGWQAAQSNPKPAAPAATPSVTTPSTPTAAVPAQLPEVVDNSSELAEVTQQLEQEQQKNLQLTDELARAQDQLDVGGADTQALKDQIEQQGVRIEELEEALQLQKEQQASLVTENQALQQQLDKLQAQAVKEPENLWRTVMSNPLYLILGALVPGLLLLFLIWFMLKKRKDKAESTEEQDSSESTSAATETQSDAAPEAALASDSEATDDSDMAVHLDTEEEESIDSLMNVDDNMLQPEADMVDADSQVDMAEEMFVDSGDTAAEEENDEGQSLDDLWAEAMGEQEEDETPADTAAEEDDLDALLADLDTPSSSETIAATDETDLAEFDTEFPQTESSDEAAQSEDLDALLAEFDAPEAGTPADELAKDPADDLLAESDAQSEQDLDSLLAEFDEPESDAPSEAVQADEAEQSADDIDNLLAEFDEPASDEPSEVAQADESEQSADDIDNLLAEFDEPASDEPSEVAQIDGESEQSTDDIDNLLAEFDEPASDEPSEAAKIDDDSEQGADDIDSLLAEFDTDTPEAEAQVVTTDNDDVAVESDSEDLTSAIAAELEEDLPQDLPQDIPADSDAELDELLAEFDKPAAETPPAPELDKEVGDAIAAELDGELANDDTELDDLLAEFDIDADALEIEESEQEDDTTEVNFADLAKPSAEAAADNDLSNDSADPALDALLADLESVDPQNTAAEPGIFDDLKGGKSSSDNSLDWDGDAGLDFESFSNSKQTGADDLASADDTDITALNLDDDKLTVDEALAALEADSDAPEQAISEHDLTSFQNDNGFIDIDKLLNDADEETVEVDQYKELDVDMGEIDDLMGNASMVDVDDEENSVNAKLDLARAYIEIDDNDSAKALLKEVELDGNERQKEEAAKLIDDLG